jgi:acyl-CoA thioester hydrolase
MPIAWAVPDVVAEVADEGAAVPAADEAWPFRQAVPIRYHECDMQQVVFNANYLMYCDLAMTSWMTSHDMSISQIDWMLVKVGMEWQGSATFGQVLDIDVGVARWGTKSFDVGFRGTVDGRAIYTAAITYVCVAPGTTETMRIPDDLRARLGPVPS